MLGAVPILTLLATLATDPGSGAEAGRRVAMRIKASILSGDWDWLQEDPQRFEILDRLRDWLRQASTYETLKSRAPTFVSACSIVMPFAAADLVLRIFRDDQLLGYASDRDDMDRPIWLFLTEPLMNIVLTGSIEDELVILAVDVGADRILTSETMEDVEDLKLSTWVTDIVLDHVEKCFQDDDIYGLKDYISLYHREYRDSAGCRFDEMSSQRDTVLLLLKEGELDRASLEMKTLQELSEDIPIELPLIASAVDDVEALVALMDAIERIKQP